MSNQTAHRSVLRDEVVAALQAEKGKLYLDATFGGGGHSRAILEVGARVIGIDRDPAVSEFAVPLQQEFGKTFRFEVLSYEQADRLEEIFDGAVMDLGISSDQLEAEGRGFSFTRNEPLDLRFNPERGQTAAQFLQQASLPQLERVFREYAQDRYYRPLSRKIVEQRRVRPIHLTNDFKAIVGSENPKVLAPLWQALRIEVNDELGALKRGLLSIEKTLKVGGRIVVISFHSLEDSIVKEFFRSWPFELESKKPLEPKSDEIATNRRARSAKLRVGIKTN